MRTTRVVFGVFCLLVALFIVGSLVPLHGGSIIQTAYRTILNAGSAVTQRANLNFVSGVTCVDNAGTKSTDCTGSGGGGGNNIRTCVVVIGDPGAASGVLSDDNDSPYACGNDYGADLTITAVGCQSDAGGPAMNPVLTGGGATSILSAPVVCANGGWAAGTLNGSPVLHSFSGGATCASTPCTADVNISTAGGAAKYIVIRIVGTL